jgi:hypothetical protein
MDKRPELAPYIAKITASWAEIEIAVGLLLATIVGSEIRTGVAMYLALTGSAAQDKVLAGVAAASLPLDLKFEFAELNGRVRKRGVERNKVVHGLWGTSATYPDALINCSPDNLVRDVSRATQFHAIFGTHPNPSPAFISELRLYKKRDFEAILERISETKAAVTEFTTRVGEAHRKRLALARALTTPPATGGEAPPPEAPRTTPED